MGKEDSIKGDKLRELILLVYLNNKYGLGKRIKLAKLKQFLGYSTGGLYNALDESGYFIRKGDEIALSASGETYVGKKLLRQFRAMHPVGYFFIFFGIILIAQWYLYTYYKVFLSLDWTTGISFIVVGLLIRFALPPFVYWVLKIARKYNIYVCIARKKVGELCMHKVSIVLNRRYNTHRCHILRYMLVQACLG